MPKLLGFAPDLDPTTAGIIVDCSNALPTVRGMAGSPSPVSMGAGTDYASRGCGTVEMLSGLKRTFFAAYNYVFEYDPAYGFDLIMSGIGGTDDRAMFASFGNVGLMAIPSAKILQTADLGYGTTFTQITSAPKARIIETINGFVMAFDCNNGTDHHTDQWWCSALYDHTDWTPSITTQSANGRLLDTSGGITAAKRIGDGIAVYKERAVYYGQYVGGDIIWSWSQVASNAGCVGADAVVNAGGVHVFVGRDDIWMFDGSRPQSIGASIKRWFFADVFESRLPRVKLHYDRRNSHVWVWYTSTAATYPTMYDKAIIYNLATGQWGKVAHVTDDVLSYIEPDGSNEYLVLVGSNQLRKMTGATATSSMTFWDMGDDDRYTTMRMVRPRFSTAPTSATVTHSHKSGDGIAWTVGNTSTVYDHKADILRSARYHRLQLQTVGDWELTDIKPEMIANGRR